MFHDQVLAPFKSIFKFNAINITLGLKYWRASPDHGVAINMIKKNKSNPLSLLECVYFFNKFKMKYFKKSLGQNFLIDKNIIRKIINLSQIENNNILEIGPGKDL